MFNSSCMLSKYPRFSTSISKLTFLDEYILCNLRSHRSEPSAAALSSKGTAWRSTQWPSAPMEAAPSPRDRQAALSSCGTWPPASASPPSRVTSTPSSQSPSAPTAPPLPRVRTTGLPSCGTWPLARAPPPSSATATTSIVSPSAPTAPTSRQPRAQLSCGASPYASALRLSPGTEPGSCQPPSAPAASTSPQLLTTVLSSSGASPALSASPRSS